jgi:hypothetical protein
MVRHEVQHPVVKAAHGLAQQAAQMLQKIIQICIC